MITHTHTHIRIAFIYASAIVHAHLQTRRSIHMCLHACGSCVWVMHIVFGHMMRSIILSRVVLRRASVAVVANTFAFCTLLSSHDTMAKAKKPMKAMKAVKNAAAAKPMKAMKEDTQTNTT